VPHFPALCYHDCVRLARERGFVFWRAGKGSHEIWVRSSDRRRTVIPHHGAAPIKRKTVKGILDDLQIDYRDLM